MERLTLTWLRALILTLCFLQVSAQENVTYNAVQAKQALRLAKQKFSQGQYQEALRIFQRYKALSKPYSFQAFEAGNFALETAFKLKNEKVIKELISQQDKALSSPQQQISQDALCHYLFIVANRDYEKANYSKTYTRLSVLLKRQLSGDGAYVAEAIWLFARSAIDLALQYEENYEQYLAKANQALDLYRKFKGSSVEEEIQTLLLELKIFKGDLEQAENDYSNSNFLLKQDLQVFLKLALNIRKEEWEAAFQTFRSFNIESFSHSQKIPVLAKLAEALIKAKDEVRGSEILDMISKSARYDYEKRAVISLQVRIALSRQNLEEVSKEFENLKDYYSDNKDFVPLAFQVAQFMQNSDEYQKPLKIYDLLLSTHKRSLSKNQNYDAHFQKGFCYEKLQKFKEARTEYSNAAKLKLNKYLQAPVLFKLGFVSNQLKDAESALQYWQELITMEVKPWSFKAKVASARLLYAEQEFEKSYHVLDEIFKNPELNEKTKSSLLLIWTDCLIRKGQLNTALKVLENELDAANDEEQWFERAKILEQLYSLAEDKSEEQLNLLDQMADKAIELKDKADLVLALRGQFFISQLQQDKARAEFDKLLLSPDKSWKNKALKALVELDSLDPNYFDEARKQLLQLSEMANNEEEKEFYTLKLYSFLVKQDLDEERFNDLYLKLLNSKITHESHLDLYHSTFLQAIKLALGKNRAITSTELQQAFKKIYNADSNTNPSIAYELALLNVKIYQKTSDKSFLSLSQEILSENKSKVTLKTDYIKMLFLEATILLAEKQQEQASPLFKKILLILSAQSRQGKTFNQKELKQSIAALENDPKSKNWLESFNKRNEGYIND